MSAELEALQEAVNIAGGQSALAAKLRDKKGDPLKQGHVWYWLNGLNKAPAEQVLPIEAATGISRHRLRPDLYPDERSSAEAAA